MDTKKLTVTKLFDCDHPYWANDQKHNLLVVKTILMYCYERFKTRRYLFLNEVYQELGIPVTRQGQIAGWVFNGEQAEDSMWTVWTKDDGYDDVYITFEVLSDILDTLPNEETDH